VIKLFRKAGQASPLRAHVGTQVGQRLDANPAVRQVAIDGVQVYYHENFLSAVQCRQIIGLIDINRRPSTLLSDRPEENFRTSESCDMDRWSPDVRPIDESIAMLLGLDPIYGETMQGQRYAVGQEFKAHTDYFEPLGIDYAKFCSVAGQRTWTAMIYLNEPVAGGATRFKTIDKIVQPEAGKLLMWDNRRADGTPNPSTIHHGMKVRAGTKYVLTKWFRERTWG